ncbi:hypothetical protein HU200_057152 [Digitaria exilis]|uniref:Uncharacterized protein n=1 Tax=Digitaria exilis TaxID=1010633 RepID=A0A835AFT2_9POAL|nr:hypothetical protein HU200_057152 [Digitaria exilis]
MAAPRKLGGAAKQAAALVSGTLSGDAALPWDVVGEKLAELLRFLASIAQALAAELWERAASLAMLAHGALAVALPAAAAVAVLLLAAAWRWAGNSGGEGWMGRRSKASAVAGRW